MLPRHAARPLAALTLVMLALAGCGDSATAPTAVSAVYALVSRGGEPVPVTIWRDSTAGVQSAGIIVGDTLALRADGSFRSTSAFRTLRTRGTTVIADSMHRATYNGRYRIVGDRFEYLTDPCPPNALCAAPPTGTFENGALVLRYANSPPAYDQRYVRVGR